MRVSRLAIASVFAGTLGFITVAHADDNFDIGQVSIAYADGYRGVDHQFHPWEHRADAEAFRAKHLDHYRPWSHDDPRHAKDKD